MSFTRKQIALTFTLGTGAFGDTGTNTVTLSGLRASAQIAAAGGASMSELRLQVWGLTETMLNDLTALNTVTMLQRNNAVIVSAGDAVSGLWTIYEGTISSGWAQIAAPESCLDVTAHAGLIHKVSPALPRGYATHADVAVIMASIALEMGLPFENNGVSVQLSTSYLHGSLYDQADAVAAHAHIDWGIDRGTFYICPKGAGRIGTPVLVSPQTGMVGFPSFTSTGIEIVSVFNPTISILNTIQVQSSFKPANGQWFVCGVAHSLHSETPNGDWSTHLQAAPLYASNVLPS